jgi:predicted negative regulator of RcsB-dependent stress response
MKSQHRHELETNALSKWLDVFVAKVGPHATTILGVLVALVVIVFGYSYITSESAAQQSEGWNVYNQAVEGYIPNLEALHQAAQENAGTPMQALSDLTWADGQVWMAARAYIQNRAAGMEVLNKALGTYENVIKETNDPKLASRAHFGLARLYELKGDLEKARAEYQLVQGGFSEIAKQRADDLAEKRIQEACDWLATAEAPRRAAPGGPGTPGKRPGFDPGELALPGSDNPDDRNNKSAVEDLFKSLQGPAKDRYNAENNADDNAAPPDDSAKDSGSRAPAKDAAQPK